MKTSAVSLCSLLAALALAGCQSPTPAPDAGRVAVSFPNAENYTDFRDSRLGSEAGRRGYEDILRRALQREAVRVIPADARLAIEFKDIDLAGEFVPAVSVHADHIRVIESVYRPRAAFHFTLTGPDGAVLKEGDRDLRDLNFLQAASANRNEPLHWDIELLRHWLRSEFR